MGFKRYDGCIICVLFQISRQLQTQIVKNIILSDSLLGNKLYFLLGSWGAQCIIFRDQGSTDRGGGGGGS